MKAIILHGTLGSPDGNWFKWLEKELIGKGWQVWLPTLPHVEQPSLKEWATFVAENAPFSLDDQTLIIGHSSGAILALIVCQELQKSVKATICVSAFKNNDLGWEPNDRLFDVPFDFPAIREHAGKLIFIHSDDDPYCPLEHAQYLSKESHGELMVVSGQGHFNLEKSDQYRRFPKLIEIIEEKVGL